MTEPRRRTPKGFILITLLASLLLLSGTAAAAIFTIENPEGLLTAGETAVIPVTISDASDIAGFQLYIKHDSSASLRIKADSAAVKGLSLNPATNKAVYYPDPDAYPSLYGTKKLFDLEITPAAGENTQLTFDIIEVIDSANNDITASCVGVPSIIRVTDGKTAPPKEEPTKDPIEWVYDTTQGLVPEDQSYILPQPAGSIPQPTYQSPYPAYTVRPDPVKSPGILPITLLCAFGAAAALIIRQNRKRGT